nr:sodium:proton antiporter [Rhodococcus sp. HNM0569]
MLVTVLVVGLGDRFDVPWPVLLTLVAGAAAFLPGIPHVALEPELILPIFLPPLLWALARRTSWSMFRAHWQVIAFHSIGLVVLTTVAVTWTAWILLPGIAVAAAIAIGAMAAPPDPVAVEAVAEPVGIPRRIVSALQTEGLFNDAAALVAFQAAIAATVAGRDVDYGLEGLEFLYTAGAAVVLGFVAGWLANWVTVHIVDGIGRAGFTLVVPFVVYLLAEEIHASGVIAVVIAAVQVASSEAALDPEDRLASSSFWGVAELMVTGLAFGLIGLDFRQIIEDAGADVWTMVWHGVIVGLVLLAVRFVWMWLTSVYLRKRGDGTAAPASMREVVVMTWCGMRGLVTLALALSLPADFPYRSEAVVIAAMVLVMSMILPGLTLPWLVRTLGVSDVADAEAKAEAGLAHRARTAALGVVAGASDSLPPEVVTRVRALYERMTDEDHVAHGDPEGRAGDHTQEYNEHVQALVRRRREMLELQQSALEAARAEVVRARSERGQDPQVADRVLERLDRLASANDTFTARH